VTSCIRRDVEETLNEDNPVLVHKRGFGTGETNGLLIPVAESLDVEGRLPDGSPVLRTYLRGFFVYGDGRPFAKPGDSGAIVVDDDDCVVGMIVALRAADSAHATGSDPAFVVPIGDLVEYLGVDLLGPARRCTIV
jgi:S1-C subfamily serine protease